MQKIKQIILIIGLILICTSCGNVKYEMEINKDGSANFAYIMELNKSDFEIYQKKYDTTLKHLTSSLEQSGFSINRYDEEEKVKFEAKIYLEDIRKIDEFDTLLSPLQEGQPTISYEKNIFGEQYEINAKIDLTSYSETKKDIERDEIIANNLPIEFNLKIPVKVSESNATIDEGSNLTWKLKYNQENVIAAKYEIINYTTIIILCIILFIVVQFITFKIVKKIITIKNNK